MLTAAKSPDQAKARSSIWAQALSWKSDNQRAVLGTLGVVLLLTLWQLSVVFGFVDPQFSSSPFRIFKTGVDYFANGSGLEDLTVTASTFAWGFFTAVLAGIVLGILLGWFRPFESFIEPIFNFAYTSPRPALFPLFVIWFGIRVEIQNRLGLREHGIPRGHLHLGRRKDR